MSSVGLVSIALVGRARAEEEMGEEVVAAAVVEVDAAQVVSEEDVAAPAPAAAAAPGPPEAENSALVKVNTPQTPLPLITSLALEP